MSKYPLADVMQHDRRWLPCKVYPNTKEPSKLVKMPVYRNSDGPTAKDWENPAHWLTWAEAVAAQQEWRTQALSFQFGGEPHDVVGVDLDKCLRDGALTERAARLLAALNSYTTISVSGKGLHIYLIDRTGLMPCKYAESDEPAGIGIYRHAKHFADRFTPYGELKPVRVITDPAEARAICIALGVTPSDEKTIAPGETTKTPAPDVPLSRADEIEKARLALSHLAAARCDDYAEWLSIGFSLHELGGGGLTLWDEWSKGSAKYDADVLRAKWETMSDGKAGAATLQSLYFKAQTDSPGWRLPRPASQPGKPVDLNRAPDDADRVVETDLPQSISEVLQTRHLTDWGNGECLKALHGDKLRFDHTRQAWLVWNGQRWLQDETGQTRRLMVDTIRARQAEIPKIDDDDKKKRYASFVVGSENAAKLTAALSCAGSLAELATKIDQYDRDPMLANAGAVTLDLQICKQRPNDLKDYITRRLGADFDGGAQCPRWLQFLNEVFNGNKELISYIRRAVGYSLTGDTREQKLFLCHGGGTNGKSVFLAVIGALLGEYAASRSFSTFDADERNRVGDDLAGLKGVRFLSVIETNEDKRLNEARVKSLTGQDEINCRFLFGEYFSFRPQFKLWIALNFKPAILGTDRAIWRRIHLIPFTQSFEGREDRTLERKLEAELAGILNWALDGLQEWHAMGLNAPGVVAEATEQYRAESDVVGQWLQDCTATGAEMRMKAGEGYKNFKEWCVEHGINKTMPQIYWSRRMAEHELTPGARTGKGVFYEGIGLLMSSDALL